MSDHPRLPLILSASRAAVDQARRLGVDRPLENLVEEAIKCGDLEGGHQVGHVGGCPIPEFGVFVVLNRTRAPSGRKAFHPIGVKRLDRKRRAA
jgi:hypothetical protein